MDFLDSSFKSVSRFDPVRLIAFRDGAFDPCNSYFLAAVPKLPKAGEYIVKDAANRPDIISSDIFCPKGRPDLGDTQYWWLLLLYNGLWDSTGASLYPSIPKGTVISFFSIDDLERLYFSLRARQLGNISPDQ